MKARKIIGVVAVLSLILTSSLAFAGWGGWRGSGGWGMGSPYNRMYNSATVVTVSGTVETVDKITPIKGMYSGIHLVVKTEKESIDIHLGPEWYIERLDTKIEKGDKVEVKGSKITYEGKPAVIAAEVKKGDNTLILRDSAGIPAWAGWRR
ncbi:MAG: DNA-binding protein [Nitrospirae bacterium]|nr:DNA-binding protein [Nitrospirota bacterium]